MRKFVPMIAAAVLVMLAQSAYASVISGKIHNIDTVRNTFAVGDKYFQWSAANSVGARLKDLREGERVRIVYEANQDGHNDVQEMRVQH
jgi:hypothetical protein